MTMIRLNNRPGTRSWTGLVNDLFSDFDSNLGNLVGQINQLSTIPVNIKELENGFALELSVPGYKKEGFGLNVEQKQIVVEYDLADVAHAETSAEGEDNAKAVKEDKYLRKEFSPRAFKRSFTIDDKIDTDGINAKYEDGILTIWLPKKPEHTPVTKRIGIS